MIRVQGKGSIGAAYGVDALACKEHFLQTCTRKDLDATLPVPPSPSGNEENGSIPCLKWRAEEFGDDPLSKTASGYDVIKKTVDEYCDLYLDPTPSLERADGGEKDGKESIDSGEGARRLHREVLKKFTRTKEIRSTWEYGTRCKEAKCAKLFWAYFDAAETHLEPRTITAYNTECILGEPQDRCNDTLAGYEIGSKSLAQGRRCDVTLREARANALSEPVQDGIRRYYREIANDDCSTRTSLDCTGISICGSGPNEEQLGVQAILTANLGSLLGKGLGFRNDGIATFSVSTYLGLRGFMASGLVDLRAGLGLGVFQSDTSVSNAMGSSPSATPHVLSGILFTTGFGIYHGLVALNYLHTWAVSDSSDGNGLALLVDAATVAKLIDRR